MRHIPLVFSLIAALGPAAAIADENAAAATHAVGAALYKIHCAPCHGVSGRGDGPKAAMLEFAPADLTRITERNRGRFPFERVVQIVDGRKPPKGHVRSDMPVWADALLDPHERYDPQKVKTKIRQIVQYLASIQETAASYKP
jgi:mono/diheme cytochrome c family protein